MRFSPNRPPPPGLRCGEYVTGQVKPSVTLASPIAAAQRLAGCLQPRPGGAVDLPRPRPAARQRGVSGVDDGVHGHLVISLRTIFGGIAILCCYEKTGKRACRSSSRRPPHASLGLVASVQRAQRRRGSPRPRGQRCQRHSRCSGGRCPFPARCACTPQGCAALRPA